MSSFVKEAKYGSKKKMHMTRVILEAKFHESVVSIIQ